MPQLLPDPPDPVDTRLDAVSRKVLLESLRAAGLTGSFVGGPYLDFEPSLLPVPVLRADACSHA